MSDIKLNPSQILQINATVIAGILILMTVGSFNQPNPNLAASAFKTINQVVAFTLIPFVISSLPIVFIIYGLVTSERRIRHLGYVSFGGMLAGFSYLIYLVVVIATQP
jgi:hypothetical protein